MVDPSALASHIETLGLSRVACVGDVMLDRFVYGRVERTSPEAPVPILRTDHDVYMLGGAGNVVRNLVSLGAHATLLSVIGDDEVGRRLTGMVGREERVEPHLLVERGRRIGFTNGCFDLLHPGHISLLRQARQAADRLVVGLNNDASVRRLKGPDRPVQGEAARAQVLASLETVDLVVVFAEDTPMRLIEALRPDCLVKGSDYTVDEVVGADVVQGYGGTVLIAANEPGYSTTGTIDRLRG